MAKYFAIVRSRNVLVAAAFLVGVWGSYGVAIYWVPTLLIEAGWSEDLAGLIGSLYPFAGIVSAVGFGLLSDRFGKRKPLMFVSGIGMTVAFVLTAFATQRNLYWLLALMLPVAGLFAYGGLPLAYCLAADEVGAKAAAVANGFIMGVGLIVGGALYPLLLGFLRDATGLYGIGFLCAALSLGILNIAIVGMGRDVNAKPQTIL